MQRFYSIIAILCFFANTLLVPRVAADSFLSLPKPGSLVSLSPAYAPVLIKGLKIHPQNPLLFDFIIDTGHSALEPTHPALKIESEKIIKYFLASLTIPEEDVWVNLSPFEKERIIPKDLGQTELGRDMLAQDYLLKQIAASLIYPEERLGKEFWDRVYTKAQQQFGSVNIPINTFNKIWITAEKANVYVHNNTAYIVGAHLKVMLEEDYLATQKNQSQPGDMFQKEHQNVSPSTLPTPQALQMKAPQGNPGMPPRGHVQKEHQNVSRAYTIANSMPARSSGGPSTLPNELPMNVKAPQVNPPSRSVSTSSLSSQIITELIIPELEKEVNGGKNFAQLRQMFYAMILSTWFKNNLKDSLLNQVYAKHSKINGLYVDDMDIKNKIYEQYLKAYKKGVFNYIKEDINKSILKPMPRKYFSGGLMKLGHLAHEVNQNHWDVRHLKNPDGAMIQVTAQIENLAMTTALDMRKYFSLDQENLRRGSLEQQLKIKNHYTEIGMVYTYSEGSLNTLDYIAHLKSQGYRFLITDDSIRKHDEMDIPPKTAIIINNQTKKLMSAQEVIILEKKILGAHRFFDQNRNTVYLVFLSQQDSQGGAGVREPNNPQQPLGSLSVKKELPPAEDDEALALASSKAMVVFNGENKRSNISITLALFAVVGGLSYPFVKNWKVKKPSAPNQLTSSVITNTIPSTMKAATVNVIGTNKNGNIILDLEKGELFIPQFRNPPSPDGTGHQVTPVKVTKIKQIDLLGIKFVQVEFIGHTTNEMGAITKETYELADKSKAIVYRFIKNASVPVLKKPGIVGYETELFQEQESNKAMLHEGGINLNALNMKLQVSGDTIDMRLNQAMVNQLKQNNFSGVRPVILKITFIDNVFSFLGLNLL